MPLDGFSFWTFQVCDGVLLLVFWSVCLSVWYRTVNKGWDPRDFPRLLHLWVWANAYSDVAKQDYKMVCTHGLHHQSVNYDCLGECSPEKDCLWWHWCFDNLSGSHQRVLGCDDDFRSCCWNVSQCHHKQSFSGIHLARKSYFTDLRKTRGWKH